MRAAFEPGEVVQLRSGGALLTVSGEGSPATSTSVTCVFHNPVSGSFEKVLVHAGCLKRANDRPSDPGGPARSSLS